jgi:integrase
MPRLKLTVRSVAALRAPTPSRKNLIYWDDGTNAVRGFGVLCSGSTATRNYVVQRDINGRTTRVTLGGANEMTLPEARKAAGDYQLQMRQGINPKEKKSCSTLKQALAEFRAARSDRLKPRSEASYVDLITRHLADWLDLPLSSITPKMVEAEHSKIAADVAAAFRAKAQASARRHRERASQRKRRWPQVAARHLEQAAEAERRPIPNGRATANGTMRALRAVWNYAARHNPDLGPNPAKLEKWFRLPRRERLVKADDLSAFYKGILALNNPVRRDYLLLILFTGLRRREAASLRWDDVDFKAGVIRVPANTTKAARKLDLPMVDVVRTMLEARRRLGDGGWVFIADSKSGHIEEPKSATGQIAKHSGVKISVHDLRRTYLTIAENCEVSPIALKALVNHALSDNDVTEGYIVMTTARLREPAQKVAIRSRNIAASLTGGLRFIRIWLPGLIKGRRRAILDRLDAGDYTHPRLQAGILSPLRSGVPKERSFSGSLPDTGPVGRPTKRFSRRNPASRGPFSVGVSTCRRKNANDAVIILIAAPPS